MGLQRPLVCGTRKKGFLMPRSCDRFEEFLRAAFKAGVPEPEYEADRAPPETVPPELKARALAEARRFSARKVRRTRRGRKR